MTSLRDLFLLVYSSAVSVDHGSSRVDSVESCFAHTISIDSVFETGRTVVGFRPRLPSADRDHDSRLHYLKRLPYKALEGTA